MKNKETKSIFSSLENYPSIPPPDLWDKIEVQLDKPKKKSRAIIWWSIAASLIVGLSIPTIMHFTSNEKGIELNIEDSSNQVVFENSNGVNTTIEKGKLENANNLNTGSSNQNSAKHNVINEESNSSTININNNTLNNANQVVTTKAAASSSKNKVASQARNSDNNSKQEPKSNEVVAAQNSSRINSKTKVMYGINNQNSNSKENSKTTNSQNSVVYTSTSRINNDIPVQNSYTEDNKKAVVNNQNVLSVPSKLEVISDIAVQNNILKENKKAVANNQNVLSVPSKSEGANSELTNKKEVYVSKANANSIADANTQKNIISPSNFNNDSAEKSIYKDSLNKIKIEVTKLEQALVELDKDKIKKKTNPESIDKWSLQVFAGVMSSQNYNNEKAFGNAVASKQSGGYGIKTNYKLNKKWAVSSGFKINELGQKIEGVSYYEQVSTSGMVARALPLANDFAQSSSSNVEIVSISTNSDYLFAANLGTENGFEKGDVTQNLKYFEMPVEISYAILNKKKANITMNTGGFVGKLISNDIALNGNSIGENKNVNEYVYGTLLSSTLQYEFYKKTKFFIEPGMNYYINPLENQNFNQFQWMFNVGLNVSF